MGKIKRSTKTKGNIKIRNATVLEVDGIKFRSKLEVFIYKSLLSNGINDFDYEKHRFILMDSFEANGKFHEPYEKKIKESDKKYKGFGEANNNIRAITCIPDFVCINPKTKEGWIIEGKGWANDGWANKFKLFKNYLSKNGYNISYYLPNNQENVLRSIQSIKSKYYK